MLGVFNAGGFRFPGVFNSRGFSMLGGIRFLGVFDAGGFDSGVFNAPALRKYYNFSYQETQFKPPDPIASQFEHHISI